MMRIKRCFGKIAASQRGSLLLSDTPENARDLAWFAERYPLEIADREYLLSREQQHRALDADIVRILTGEYIPREAPLALPPREYQRLAAELAWRTKGRI